MKSYVLKLFDYKNIDLSPFYISFEADYKKIQNEINRLITRYSTWQDGDIVSANDSVVISMVSELAKYNRESLPLIVGSNLLNNKLERELIGMKTGEFKELMIDEKTVKVTVISVKNRVFPEFDDAFIKDKGPDGIESVEAFKSYLIDKQKEEALEHIYYDVERFVIDNIFKNSEFVIAKEDYDYFLNLQIKRLSYISNMEGYDLKKMTAEEFEGKIPVSSYFELEVDLRKNNWDYLEAYLAGVYLSEKNGDIVDTTEATYIKQMEEYAYMWRCSVDDAKNVNVKEEFDIGQYQNYFYQVVRDFYEEVLKKAV